MPVFIARVDPIENNLWDASADVLSANLDIVIVVFTVFILFLIWGAIKTSKK
jgi:hypothetical protein